MAATAPQPRPDPGRRRKSRSARHDYELGPSVSWELDFFGRLRSLEREALYQYLASGPARKAERILLVSQVADQYLTMLALDEELAVTRRRLDNAQKSYELTRLQYRTGIGDELSLREAETVVEQAKANLASQMRARAQAKNALVLLLGQALPTDLPPTKQLGSQSLLADIPAGVPSDLLTRRPDIIGGGGLAARGQCEHRRTTPIFEGERCRPIWTWRSSRRTMRSPSTKAIQTAFRRSVRRFVGARHL